MKKLLVILLVALILPGCAPKVPFTSEEIQSKTRKHFELASQYEQDGELKKALVHYQIAGNLDKDNESYRKGIARISRLIREKAASHYQRAMKLQEKGMSAEARNELLMVLWYDNDHDEALQALKKSTERELWQTYQVKPGDSLERIAERKLGSNRNAALVAALNGLQLDDILPVGALLTLPNWDVKSLTSAPKIVAGPDAETEPAMLVEELGKEYMLSEQLALVRQHIKQKQYAEALEIIAKIKQHDPQQAEALDLEETVYCDFARHFADNGDFNRAERILGKASPHSTCRDATEAFISVRRDEEAQRLYLVGVKHYINEDLQEAIRTWERTLELNPDHARAKADKESATDLLEKLNKVK